VTPEYEAMNEDERAAYDEALRLIEEVRKSGGTELKVSAVPVPLMFSALAD